MIIKRGEPCSSSRIDLQLTKSLISVFLSLEKAVFAALTTVVERFTRPTEHEGRPRRKPRARVLIPNSYLHPVKGKLLAVSKVRDWVVMSLILKWGELPGMEWPNWKDLKIYGKVVSYNKLRSDLLNFTSKKWDGKSLNIRCIHLYFFLNCLKLKCHIYMDSPVVFDVWGYDSSIHKCCVYAVVTSLRFANIAASRAR